jgi:endonuclease/exonuclease/phosphatase family metal-dependent hydrolase
MTTSRYTECLSTAQARLVPTYRHTDGSVKHQIDHVFVSADLAERLLLCSVGSPERVFAGGLSDHLPIVADFA